MQTTQYSKVSVEFCEEALPGRFNVIERTSGTVGAIAIGEDIAYALADTPRPTLSLAEAIKHTFNRSQGYARNHPLLKAAQDHIAKWQQYDDRRAKGENPASIPWPDAPQQE